MREEYRLRLLQMGVAGKYGFLMLFRQREQGARKRGKLFIELGDHLFLIHAEVQRHLVVAASCRMQLLAGFADALGQQAFNIHMDVFIFRFGKILAVRQIFQDARKTVKDLLTVCLRDDPLFGKHFGVCHTAGDVLFPHAPVKRQRRVELVRGGVFLLGKSAFPELH